MRTLLFLTLLLCSLAHPAFSQTAEIKPLFTPLKQTQLQTLLKRRPIIIDARMPNERVGEFARYQLDCKGRCPTSKLVPYDVDFGLADDSLGSFRCQPGQKVLIVCLAGVRSAHLANYLITTGRCKPGQVTSLQDGLMEKYRLEQENVTKKLAKK